MNTVKIQNIEMLSNKDVLYFFNPDYVYVPMFDGFEIKVDDKNIVKREQIIMTNKKKNLYSSISGKVLGKTVDMGYNGKTVSSVVIENDFTETTKKHKGVVRSINNYSVDDLAHLLNLYNTRDDFNFEGKYLVINGFDFDPYEYTNSFIINYNSDKLLETVDALINILGLENAYFVVNNNDSMNVINLNNNIGTYPNIKLKLIENVYPLGNRTLIVNKVLGKKNPEDVIYLTVEDVLNIYNVLKRKQPIINKYVTLSGVGLSEKAVVCTKIGVSFKDLILNVSNIKLKNYDIVVNGLLAGYRVNNLNEMVTSETRSIFIVPRLKEHTKECINCGLCNSKCPVGLNPKYLLEHKKADRSKCINCGLCTYICPAKINFKNALGGVNHE